MTMNSAIEDDSQPELQVFMQPLMPFWTDAGSEAKMSMTSYIVDGAPADGKGWLAPIRYGVGGTPAAPGPFDTSVGLLVRQSTFSTTNAVLSVSATAKLVWRNDHMFGNVPFAFWSAPDAPAGYCKIGGDKIVANSVYPTPETYTYVREDLCEPVGPLQLMWNDHGSGNDDWYASVWGWESPQAPENNGVMPWRVVTGYDAPTDNTYFQIKASAMDLLTNVADAEADF